MTPDIAKHPVEFYGHFHQKHTEEAENDRDCENCPFIGTKCKKRRKSEPEITIGTCSVGYKKRGQEEYSPHIICPHRFKVDTVFDAISDLFVEDGELFLVPEKSLMGTSVDFVMGKKEDGEVIDFAGVEIQALDTTGSVWQHKIAYEDEDQSMTDVNKTYGINWAMSITKTMMQQAYRKGQAFDLWDENLIFIVQDVSIEYLRQNYDTSELREARPEDPVHFYSFTMNFNQETQEYELELSEKLSSTIAGVSKMMIGEEVPDRDEFSDQIADKLDL